MNFSVIRDDDLEPVRDLLTAARLLLSEPDAWTKAAYARTRTGNAIGPQAGAAFCFCSVGAINAIGPYLPQDRRSSQVRCGEHVVSHVVRERIGFSNIAAFNDSSFRTHSEVLAVFDRAVELMDEEIELRKPESALEH
jgi:hypothetical protein